MEEVEEMDLDHYLRLAEQFKPVLGPGHYQLVMIRRFIHTITGSKPGRFLAQTCFHLTKLYRKCYIEFS